ncbi:hypothetical protein [Antrihabitans spumae]|uniref:Terminase n=1 Tax=Antrihabitans spumae TaxID=3373370 RepID=A0ABW7K9Y5_9NOCA
MRSFGGRAIALTAAAGRELFPWQQSSLIDIQGVRADGKWAAYEAALLTARQNGKTGDVESLELDWMCSEPGIPILHTAHEARTATKSLKKLLALIQGLPGAAGPPGPKNSMLASVRTGKGDEAIVMHNGSFVDFATRTASGGRGTSYERLVVDEAMIYTPESQAALLPLINTASNGQIVYAGTAPDESMQYSQIWADLYWRALAGNDPVLCYLGWLCEQGADPDDPVEWAKANPSMGHLFPVETIANARRSMRSNVSKFLVEYMSIGVWPKPGGARKHVIDMGLWGDMTEHRPPVSGPIALALEMDSAQRWVTIAAATRTIDGRIRLEIGYLEAPSPKVLDKVLDLVLAWDPCCLVMRHNSPAKSMLPDLRAKGIEPEIMSSSQDAEACGGFYTDAVNQALSHANDPRLTEPLEGAGKKTMTGGTWVWDEQTGAPLQAATAARWGLITFGAQVAAPPPSPSFDAVPENAEFDIMSAAF